MNNALLDIEQSISYIVTLVKEGFTSGYYPYWQLVFIDIKAKNISDCSLDHIAKCVSDDYREGEILEEDGNRIAMRGWWKIIY